MTAADPRAQALHAITAGWNNRHRKPGRRAHWLGPREEEARAEAFRAFGEVAFGEVEALLRVERTA